MRRLNIDKKILTRRLEVITKMLSEGGMISKYRSVFKGRGGVEFDGYKEYSQQDDSALIDWKATVRAHKVLIKQVVEERDLDVFFLVDVSNSMIFGSTKKLKNEYAAELVSALAYVIAKSNDNIGLFLFNDKVTKVIPPSKGMGQFNTIVRTLADPYAYGGNYNLTNTINYFMGGIQRQGLVFIISDFIGLEPNWDLALRKMAAKFDVIGIMIRDPRDMYLETDVGQVVISDPYSNREIQIDPKAINERYKQYTQKQLELVRAGFRKSKAELLEINTAEPYIKRVVSFFTVRGRRWK